MPLERSLVGWSGISPCTVRPVKVSATCPIRLANISLPDPESRTE
ncbi:hypothetical protein AHiyo4_28760 [Arthrobacter sp. Hiyo4]|nr:hypothetical protein AHiyo4_28760 [Arthrobacter sp. Hiyo4]